jgi:hypothetical protein
MDKSIKSDFLRKHFYYVGVFAFVWGCYLANAYFDLFYPGNENSKAKDAVDMVSRVASVLTGTLLTFIRTGEPYFRY